MTCSGPGENEVTEGDVRSLRLFLEPTGHENKEACRDKSDQTATNTCQHIFDTILALRPTRGNNKLPRQNRT